MTKGPVVIENENVSYAWATAFNELAQAPMHEIVPLVVCITGFDAGIVREDQRIRTLLDTELRTHRMQSIRTVASTIFPSSLWNPHNPPQDLFDRYARVLPRIRKHRLNCYGIYFERMIRFHPKDAPTAVNQIEYILATRQGQNRRRSAYQLSIIDPTRDHTNQPRRGFPCLQQVSISPISEDGLSVTGFYATQTLFERAYGNYIGLCELGRFFAHEWGMQLSRVTCVASVAKLGIPANEGHALAHNSLRIMNEAPEVMATNEG
jgi:thymidylate synthase